MFPKELSSLYEIKPSTEAPHSYSVVQKNTYSPEYFFISSITYPFMYIDTTTGRILTGVESSTSTPLNGIDTGGYNTNLNDYLSALANFDIDNLPSDFSFANLLKFLHISSFPSSAGTNITSNAGISIKPNDSNISVDLLGAGKQRDAYYDTYNDDSKTASELVKVDWNPNYFSVERNAMIRWNRYVFVGTDQGIISGIIPLTQDWTDVNKDWSWNSIPKCLVDTQTTNCPFFQEVVTSLGVVDDKLLVGTRDFGIYVFNILPYPDNYNGSQPILKYDGEIPFNKVQSKPVNAISGYMGLNNQITVYYGNDSGLYSFVLPPVNNSLLKSENKPQLKTANESKDPFNNQSVDWE